MNGSCTVAASGAARTEPHRKENAIWRPFLASNPERSHCPDPSPSGTFYTLRSSRNSAFRPVKKKRLQCGYCSTSFVNGGQLAGHVRIHTGDKPFKCGFDACSRAFARSEELTRHRRIHSGDKPHACDVCHKRFGRKDHLNKHRKTHLKDSEKKVYVCREPGCGHSYTRTDALARHRWTVHSVRRPTCKEPFVPRSDLSGTPAVPSDGDRSC